MTIISGILTDGTGQIINDCTIELYAKKTTINVLTQTQAFTVANDGKYSINVLPCEYDVSLIINGFPKKRLGSINVYSDSRNGTLNDFLINPTQTEVTPEFIKQVMDARDDAKKSANNAQKWASTIDTSTLVKKTGDTMTGQLILSELGIKHRYTDSENLMVLRTIGDNYSCMFYDAEKKQWLSKLVYNSTTNSWNFPSIDDVKINNKSVLTKRSYGIGVSHVLGDESIDETKNQYSGFLFTQQQSKGEKPFNYSHVMRSAVNDSFTDFAVDILSKRAKFRGVLTDEKNSSYTGDYSWTEFITTQNISNYLPVGIPQPWPKSTPPVGWLECNGSTFDKSKFPKLANAYPTGKLPDLRGVFIRGLDTGSGLDPNRGILSYQGDAIRNIKGAIQDGPGQAFLGHENLTNGKTDGAISIRHSGDDYLHVGNRHVRWAFFDFDASRVVPVANENRPKNIAFMYIVKAE